MNVKRTTDQPRLNTLQALQPQEKQNLFFPLSNTWKDSEWLWCGHAPLLEKSQPLQMEFRIV